MLRPNDRTVGRGEGAHYSCKLMECIEKNKNGNKINGGMGAKISGMGAKISGMRAECGDQNPVLVMK